MQIVVSLLLSFIFLVLGLIHLHWLVGGKWGMDATIPTKENGQKVLNPRKIDTVIVGLGLVVFSLFYLLKSCILTVSIPTWIMEYGRWIIPILFLLRAVGDFKYVGLFKKMKNTKFGVWDTRLFTPLCLVIGALGLALAILF